MSIGAAPALVLIVPEIALRIQWGSRGANLPLSHPLLLWVPSVRSQGISSTSPSHGTASGCSAGALFAFRLESIFTVLFSHCCALKLFLLALPVYCAQLLCLSPPLPFFPAPPSWFSRPSCPTSIHRGAEVLPGAGPGFIEGIRHGFKLGFTQVRVLRSSAGNKLSAVQHPDVIDIRPLKKGGWPLDFFPSPQPAYQQLQSHPQERRAWEMAANHGFVLPPWPQCHDGIKVNKMWAICVLFPMLWYPLPMAKSLEVVTNSRKHIFLHSKHQPFQCRMCPVSRVARSREIFRDVRVFHMKNCLTRNGKVGGIASLARRISHAAAILITQRV